MEKFSNWRDKGTGISPFLPLTEPAPGLFSQLRALLTGPVVFLVKAPSLLLFYILSHILAIPAVLGFIVQFFFGIKKTVVAAEGIRQLKTAEIDAQRPTIGDFVVVNYATPIDALIVAANSRASWKNTVVLVPDANGSIYSYTPWSFASHAFGKIGSGSGLIVTDMLAYKDKLVLLFIEGTPSNNKAVLPFANITVPAKGYHFKTVSLKVAPASLAVPIPTVSQFGYFYGLLTAISKATSVRIKIFDHGKTDRTLFDWNLSKGAFKLDSFNIIGGDLDIAAKQKFYSYFVNHKLKNE